MAFVSCKQILLILLLIAIICELSSQQNSKPKRKNRNKNRNRKKSDVEEGITCLTCYVDFRRQPFKATHPCYNPGHNKTESNYLYLTRCPLNVKYCAVEITRANSVLQDVDRRCHQASDNQKDKVPIDFCQIKGYGVVNKACTFFCPGIVTEDNPEYDPDVHDNFTCPYYPSIDY